MNEYNIPLIIISENNNILESIKNGELYELVERWKQSNQNKFKPYTYKITLEDFKDFNDYIDMEIVYTYDENDQVYIVAFNGELICVTTNKVIMNKEMKSLTKLIEKL